MFQRFRFANAIKRIAHNGLDQIERSQGYLAIGLDPIAQILTKLGLENGGALDATSSLFFARLCQGQPRDASRL